MNLFRQLLFLILIIMISFVIIGGCGGGNGNDGNGGELAGETDCEDMIDNDDDGEIDCDDIDCIVDPACGSSCEELVTAFCDRANECGILFLIPCEDGLEAAGFDCDILEITTPQQCIDDIDQIDCQDFDLDNSPESCEDSNVTGACQECEDDVDCEEGLVCLDCFDGCTGNVKRCTVASLIFLECEDGSFRIQK